MLADAAGSQGIQIGSGNTQTNTFSFGTARDSWCKPRFAPVGRAATPGVPLALTLLLHNPFGAPRTVTLHPVGVWRRLISFPTDVELTDPQTAVTLSFVARPTDPPGGALASVEIDVRHGTEGELVGEAATEVMVRKRVSVNLAVVDPAHAPSRTVTVRVSNDGNVPVDAAVQARPYAKRGNTPPISASPRVVAVKPRDDADVTVTLPPILWRTRSFGLYAEVMNRVIAGPVLRPPGGMLTGRRRLVSAAVAAFVLAGLGLNGLQARSHGDVDPATPTMPPGRVDMFFDTPGDSKALTRPVLRDREGRSFTLSAGGRITGRVKVPAGWVLNRETVAGNTIVWVRNGVEVAVATGQGHKMWMDSAGTRILIDRRSPGTAGAVTAGVLVPGKGFSPASQTNLPADARVLDWIGSSVLIAFGETGNPLLDVWRTGTPYRPNPTGPWGKVLGATSRGSIVVHHKVAGQACLSLLSLARPFELQNRRCKILPPLDIRAMSEFWWPTSASGNMIALPRETGEVYVANIDGWFAKRPNTKLAVPAGTVIDLAWVDDRTVSMLIDTSPGTVWTCDSLSGDWSNHMPNAPEGLTVAGLVTRLPP